MILQDLHMHSTFDDGRDTCRAMLEACAAKGMESAGISLHSPLPFPNDWAAAETGPFLSEMAALRAEFRGRLRVYAGIEMDVLSAGTVDLAPFDYVIGSAHHLPCGGIPPSVDNTPEETERALTEVFAGDADAMAEAYYREVTRAAENPAAQILGHFDLLLKFSERRALFDPESPRYRRAALSALEAAVSAGKLIEVNTGAMSRGWRTAPYPSKAMLLALRSMGGRVLLSSDAHSARHVGYAFSEAAALLRACGFTEHWILAGDGASAEFEARSLASAGPEGV